MLFLVSPQSSPSWNELVFENSTITLIRKFVFHRQKLGIYTRSSHYSQLFSMWLGVRVWIFFLVSLPPRQPTRKPKCIEQSLTTAKTLFANDTSSQKNTPNYKFTDWTVAIVICFSICEVYTKNYILMYFAVKNCRLITVVGLGNR